MREINSIVGSVGGTPLVELRRVIPDRCARIIVKLESRNPTGSMKDRMALAVFDGAVSSGLLSASGMVVEYTGSSLENLADSGPHVVQGLQEIADAQGSLQLIAELSVFETDIPPQHMWMPEKGRYRLLWKGVATGVLLAD